MSEHQVYFPDLREPLPSSMVLGGPEAHHAARVKRLEVGARLRLCNGRGLLVGARISDIRKVRGEWEVELGGLERQVCERALPQVDVYAAVPKGDRLHELIDGLSQVGAAVWHPLVAERTVVEPRAGKLERLERIAVESLKQCGRAWLLEVGAAVTVKQALKASPPVVVADSSGTPYAAVGAAHVVVLVGPEGGWTPAELDLAKGSGARIARFGPHTMRIELAAVVAAAAVMDQEARVAQQG